MHTDPWMKVDLADTFNRHVEAMVPFYDRATLEMIRDADVLKDMWPDLAPLYGR